MLPANLPSIAHAKLPATYDGAKAALEKCSRIDECAEWANKAEALASYAKQAEDAELQKMAERIRARAIRRCGELLRAIKRPEQGGRPTKNGGGSAPVSRAQAGRDAGLSRDQRRDAIRVARVPEADFEAAVESDDPPTVTRLLEERRPKPIVDLKGRDPREYAAATQALGLMRRFAEFTTEKAPEAIARGASGRERVILRKQAAAIIEWLKALLRETT